MDFTKLANVLTDDSFANAVIYVSGLIGLYVKQRFDARKRHDANEENFEELKKQVKADHLDTKRIELQAAIDHKRPKSVVGKIFDEYKGLNGNSYMEQEAVEYLNNPDIPD